MVSSSMNLLVSQSVSEKERKADTLDRAVSFNHNKNISPNLTVPPNREQFTPLKISHLISNAIYTVVAAPLSGDFQVSVRTSCA